MALAPLTRLPPLRASFLPTGGAPGTGDPGGGDPNTGNTGGPVIYGPPQQGPGPTLPDPGTGDTRCPPGEYYDDSTGTCYAGTGTGSGGTGSSSGGCNLLNPFTWSIADCLLRFVILILGLICVVGGIYMLKPGLIDKPLKIAGKAAALAA